MSQPSELPKYPGPRVLVGCLCLWALIGCGHTDPFTSQPFDTDQPFSSAPPIRLTLNQGADRRPAWLPDGSGILYSTEQLDSQQHDVCLVLLPSTGGRQRSRTCTLAVNGVHLTEALESAAAQPDGRLTFVASVSRIGARVPDEQEVVVASVADPISRTSLFTIPYTLPGRPLHGGVAQLRWLGQQRLLYLAEAVNVVVPCQFCQADTVRTGRDAVWVTLDGAAANLHPIPGTENSSGVSAGGSEDEVYYTLSGDTRVFRQILSTGEVSLAHDFGAAGMVRDVHVVGQIMTAVVGGRVHFTMDPSLGPTQWDSGGVVHVVNLQDGSGQALEGPSAPALFRRPQLSPSGSAIVVEAYPLIFTPGPFGIDTTVSRVADLYLFGQP